LQQRFLSQGLFCVWPFNSNERTNERTNVCERKNNSRLIFSVFFFNYQFFVYLSKSQLLLLIWDPIYLSCFQRLCIADSNSKSLFLHWILKQLKRALFCPLKVTQCQMQLCSLKIFKIISFIV
jgi:hypothetical protein